MGLGDGLEKGVDKAETRRGEVLEAVLAGV